MTNLQMLRYMVYDVHTTEQIHFDRNLIMGSKTNAHGDDKKYIVLS